jgi:CRISPR-associated protein Csh1
MFVKETKNYASGFDDTNFGKNYQANVEEQLYLERASQELLDKQQVRIAGIDHCVIPKFLNYSSINVREVLYRSLKKAEWLFQVKTFDQAQADRHHALVETEEPYWVNFLGFESDGTFFKTINVIKGVSSLHLAEVIKAFDEVNRQMKSLPGAVNWPDVMTDFVGKERGVTNFNLHTLYYLIPQRKEKKNEALGIFKSVLERRKTRPEKLFAHFCSLILCHYYPTRYEAYKNVRKYPEGFFDCAVRDAVFKYLAFIKVLKCLKLLDPMENVEEIDWELLSLEETASAHFGQPIEQFFQKMEYSPAQKAMFYLGRMLSTVGLLQKDKRESVLEKVNFNGMDRNEIQRLRNSLIEKAKLHSKVNKVLFTDRQFTQHFDFNGWHMPEQEAVFFLLSGYSFGIQLKEE